MAENQDKVEEKAAKEVRGKIKADKASSEIEKELNNQNVGYKIKNHPEK